MSDYDREGDYEDDQEREERQWKEDRLWSLASELFICMVRDAAKDTGRYHDSRDMAKAAIASAVAFEQEFNRQGKKK